MSAPQPGYVITVFRSRLRSEYQAEYQALASELLELARRTPGFVSLDRFTAEDGERLSVVTFDSAAAEEAWRDHPRHIEARQLGRNRFLTEYSIAVCEVLRAHAATSPDTIGTNGQP